MYHNFKDLKVYQLSFSLAMDIFKLSSSFPKEEKYALTDQIRRSSRSVCANMAEAYRKRKYPKHFISKLSDSDCEASETIVWLELEMTCQYIHENDRNLLLAKYDEVGKLLGYMMSHPERFFPRKQKTSKSSA